METIDITGQKFCRLTALYRLHDYHKKQTYWLCVCDCGNLKEVYLGNLRNGKVKSCGCLHDTQAITHGKTSTRLYKIYTNMKARCYNKKTSYYKNYGARGIKVCDEWLTNFINFYDWANDNGYQDGLTINRIDNNGNYKPDNCEWVDMKTQQRHKRNNKTYTINGETHCLKEWCEILNLNYDNVWARINRYNWSIETALELEDKHDIHNNDC